MVGLRKDHTSPERGGKPFHISYGGLFPGFALVAVRFRALRAQDTASAHNDGWDSAPGYNTRAWMRTVRAVSLISARDRSATPLYLGLSAGVNSF